MFKQLIPNRWVTRSATAVMVSACIGSVAQAEGDIPKPEGFPEKPVRLVVPFNAGSPPDILARIIQQALSERIGQTVLVESRPGANGNIGTEYVKNQPADGYSYVVCGLTCSTADVFYKDVRFNMRTDMSPVINLGVFPSVLVVSQKSPIKSAQELLNYLKANPGSTYASWGRGGSPHIAGEQMQALGKVDLMHVPFGSSDPVMDVAAQRITFMFVPAAAAEAQKALVRELAVASAQRESLLPNLPTMDELGLKGFRMEAWNGLFTSKDVPPERLEYMNRQLNAVLQDPNVQARLKGAGMRILGGTRQQLADYFDRDNKQWHQVAKATGIQPE